MARVHVLFNGNRSSEIVNRIIGSEGSGKILCGEYNGSNNYTASTSGSLDTEQIERLKMYLENLDDVGRVVISND